VTYSVSPPAAQVDVSAFVLHRLDRHLCDLQELRDRMRMNTTTGPGHRLALTYVAVTLTEDFAEELGQVLRDTGPTPSRPWPDR
jgi:hypothetical protein